MKRILVAAAAMLLAAAPIGMPVVAQADDVDAQHVFLQGDAMTSTPGFPFPVDLGPVPAGCTLVDAALGYTYGAEGDSLKSGLGQIRKELGIGPGEVGDDLVAGSFSYTEMGCFGESGAAQYIDAVFEINLEDETITTADTCGDACYESGIVVVDPGQLPAAEQISIAAVVDAAPDGVIENPDGTVTTGYFTFTNEFGTFTGYSTLDFAHFAIVVKVNDDLETADEDEAEDN